MVNYMVQSLMERLRPLVGLKGWDYCVLWKLSEDQRFLDWMDCCCAGGGGQNSSQHGGDQELLFPVSSTVLPCRDGMLQHLRTKSCDLLAQLPSSISLDSGIHGQTLISNQPRWLNFCNSSDSSVLEETVGTGLLIPVLGGLIELFVAKRVAEDQHIVDFVTTQCHMISMEQEAMANTSNIDSIFSVNVNGGNADLDQKDPNVNFQAPISPVTAMEINLNDLAFDRYAKRNRLCSSSPMNLLQHDAFLEGSNDSFLPEKEQLGEDDHKDSSTKRKANRADSVSDCGEQIGDDDDDDGDDGDDLKFQRKTGKGAQSKNIDAERRRRKKLNDRLYTLRSLVPKISKLDRASILGDAIEFVKELQNQVKDLQDELEENSEYESGKIINPSITSNSNNLRSEILNDNGSGLNIGAKSENEESQNQSPETGRFTTDEKTQQMEPQVEVAQIEGNEFFVKVFCEHKAGGFVRLMEALSSLGLQVTNANVTSCKGLVSNAFKVEQQKRDSEMVQADHVRDSLLELTKHPSEKWPDHSEHGGGGGGGFDFNHHHHHLHSQLFSSHHHR